MVPQQLVDTRLALLIVSPTEPSTKLLFPPTRPHTHTYRQRHSSMHTDMHACRHPRYRYCDLPCVRDVDNAVSTGRRIWHRHCLVQFLTSKNTVKHSISRKKRHRPYIICVYIYILAIAIAPSLHQALGTFGTGGFLVD